MPRNKDVDAWFARYENPMKNVVQKIREFVLGADTRIEECIKWQAPTFIYLGNLASFFPKSKTHASLMFHVGAKIPGKHPRLEGTGGTSRVMKLASVAEAHAAKGDIARLVRAWCDWRDAESNDKPPAKRSRRKRPPAKSAPGANARRERSQAR